MGYDCVLEPATSKISCILFPHRSMHGTMSRGDNFGICGCCLAWPEWMQCTWVLSVLPSGLRDLSRSQPSCQAKFWQLPDDLILWSPSERILSGLDHVKANVGDIVTEGSNRINRSEITEFHARVRINLRGQMRGQTAPNTGKSRKLRRPLDTGCINCWIQNLLPQVVWDSGTAIQFAEDYSRPN